MKRLIGYTAALCLLAFTVGCGGVTSTGTLAYISNSTGTGFTVFKVNTDGTLTKSTISPQNTPAAPKVLQFSADGKWAYFLDQAGANIFAYKRSGDGSLVTKIDSYPLSGAASSLVIAPNSNFLYVALPNSLIPSQGKLAVYSIDSATGILSQVGSSNQVGYSFTELAMAPSGGLLFGLSPSQQAVVTFTLNASSGVALQVPGISVGDNPSYMILSKNGSYVYVLDHTATGVNNSTGIASANIYGYNVASSGALTQMAGSPFNGNADAVTGIAPANPVGGVTSNDNRYLFVANQGTHNISVFKINSTSGELSEVLGSTTTVNGISTSTASPYDCGAGCTTPSFAAVSTVNNALYVVDTPASKIFQYRVDQNTGHLRVQSPASVTAESSTSNPTWITIR
jgi:6-phosphogluconolactonase (cycloisomerase 2 family)